MKTQLFIEQSRQAAKHMIYTYFIENNMEKVQACFSRQAPSFIGWGKSEVFCGYCSIFRTLSNRIQEIKRNRIKNMQVYVPYATPDRSIVLVNCHICSELETGYNLETDCRFSYVYINEDGAAKILHLTVSVPTASTDDSTLKCRRNRITARLAARAADHSPNGIKYCRLDEHFTISYANQMLAQLTGYQSPQQLLEATQGRLDNLVDECDLANVRQAMGSLKEDGDVYTINYHLRTKNGNTVGVLERGHLATGKSTASYVVCCTSPLLPTPSAPGDVLPPHGMPSYEIPTEAFLKVALDIAYSNNGSEAMQQLLQLVCDLLQLAGIWVTDIRHSAQPMNQIFYYDIDGAAPPASFLAQTGNETLQFFNSNGYAQCTDTHLLPSKYRHTFMQHGITAFCQQLIKIDGENAYIVTFYQKEQQHSLSARELEITKITAQFISVILKQDYYSKEQI